MPASEIKAEVRSTQDVVNKLREELDDPDMDEAEVMNFYQILDGIADNTSKLSFFKSQDTNAKGENLIFYWERGQRKALILKDQHLGKDVAELMAHTSPQVMQFGMQMMAMPATALAYRHYELA